MKNMTGRPLPGATFEIIDEIDDDVDVVDALPPNSHQMVIQGVPKTAAFRMLLGPRCKSKSVIGN